MAIKVNGTTVINDSRALQNIASVDSTTKSAIESAGVGGQTTLITDMQSFSTSSLQISLPDYTTVRILLSKVRSNGTTGEVQYVRLTDGSNNLISGYEYAFQGTSTTTQSDVISVGGDNPLSNESSNYNSFVEMFIHNAYDSNILTQGTLHRYTMRAFSSSGGTIAWSMWNKERNQSVRFIQQLGGSFSGFYSVWGIS